MIDLNARIIPGESAAEIRIGQPISELISQQIPISVKELEGVLRYEFGPIWVWASDNIIDQIGVFQGYTGTLLERIKIGSQMMEVKESIGNIYEDLEDNLCVSNSPGWCFETSYLDSGEDPVKNLTANVVGIFVFDKPKE